ncbi:Uncharacterised protein [Neisseria meningitidis]|nr:Uncharacterised protein [Neisseria meningitidis]
MLRSILAASLLAVSFPTAAEALNYNIVEFSESAGSRRFRIQCPHVSK